MEKPADAIPGSSPVADADAEKAAQPAVQRLTNAEILAQSWSKKALIAAYTSLFGATFVLAFTRYSTKTYDAFATSAFSRHSALSTANVVNNIIGLAVYPILAKVSNIFGRADGFALSILFMVLALIMYAACQNVDTYIAGGIFEAIGDTGYVIMQQIFIADTTSLLNRGLWSSLPDTIASVPTLYLGTIVADSVLAHSTWRWGYAMWAIVLPFAAGPLIVVMFLLQQRAKKRGYRKTESLWTRHRVDPAAPDDQPASLGRRLYRLLWTDLDLLGALLLVLGLSLSLIPLSLTGSKSSDRWQEGGLIAMLVVGVVVLVLFLVWDARFAQVPFVPFRMIRERTVIAAMILSMLDFMHYSCFTTFFPSYLQVAGNYAAGHATRIDNGLRVSFQIFSVVVGVLMKYSRQSQLYVLTGVPLVVLGQGLQCYLVNVHGSHTASEAALVTAKVLVGIGRAFYQTASMVSIQGLVRKEDVAVVTGVLYASMSFGGAVGTSVGGAIWNNLLPRKLRTYLPAANKDQARKIYGSIVVAKKFAVGTAQRAAIDLAYRETQQLLAIAATAMVAPMLVVMFMLKTIDLEKRQAEQDAEKSSDEEEIVREVRTDKA